MMEQLETIDLEQHWLDRRRFFRCLQILDHEINPQRWKDRNDVDRLIHNWEKLAKLVASETVLCRRKRKVTDEYRRLTRKYNESKTEVEQAITMYVMVYGMLSA